MSCYHPLKAYLYGYDEKGKCIIKFEGNDDLRLFKGTRIPIEIPCGQCIGCRLQYSRVWADRLMMEKSCNDSSYFITLTYNDENLPISYYPDPDTGEAKVSYTLKPDDLTKFWKRLRKAYPDDCIRYFACGEYGDANKRPHYHAIVFGLHLDDLIYYKNTTLKDVLRTSEKLSKIWPFGFSVVGDVTWESCAYVARYVVKKVKGASADAYKTFGLYPEFVRMSRRPGIGCHYMADHLDDFKKYGSVYISSGKKPVKAGINRYLKQHYEDDFYNSGQERVHDLIDSVIKGNNYNELKIINTNYDLDTLRKVEECAIIESSKVLRREL